jgi:hypothetical protein
VALKAKNGLEDLVDDDVVDVHAHVTTQIDNWVRLARGACVPAGKNMHAEKLEILRPMLVKV